MNNNQLHGVVFDLDGTLIDSEPLWAKVETSVAASGGVAWTEQDAYTYFGKPLPVTTQAIVDRGLHLTVDEAIAHMLDELATIYRTEVPWLPGAFSLLSSLNEAGVATALGTQSFRSLSALVQEAAPAGALQEIVCGDELTNGKPDPEVFLTAIDRLGLTPDHAVVVEDSPTGVAAGIAAGVPVLAVPASDEVYRSYAGSPGVSIVRSLQEVTPDLLEKIRSGDIIDTWAAAD